MFSLAMFGGNKIDGSELQPGERIVGLALFGGLEVDFPEAPAPFVDVVLIALFGGVVVRVQPTQPIRMTGFSLFGGRGVESRRLPARPASAPEAAAGHADDADDDELPLEIGAYAVFGGINVKRVLARPSAPALAPS